MHAVYFFEETLFFLFISSIFVVFADERTIKKADIPKKKREEFVK